MAKQASFIKEFFKARRQVGALAPSSKFLMKKMIKPIDFSTAKCIIELGPGNGIFTKGILEQMNSDCKLFSFELNQSFYEQIKSEINDHRLTLLNRSAEDIISVIEEYGIEKVDYIVSSLPLTVIPSEIKTVILDRAKNALSDDGKYIQFQYTLNAKKLLEERFSSVKIEFTAANFPPAFIYQCSN
ncbi:MAG: methyltransferase [Flavobacteriales bacterium]|nr:methyltransferase [Flavobacteriales bacterium]